MLFSKLVLLIHKKIIETDIYLCIYKNTPLVYILLNIIYILYEYILYVM